MKATNRTYIDLRSSHVLLHVLYGGGGGDFLASRNGRNFFIEKKQGDITISNLKRRAVDKNGRLNGS
jgi:hypothetical protein